MATGRKHSRSRHDARHTNWRVKVSVMSRPHPTERSAGTRTGGPAGPATAEDTGGPAGAQDSDRVVIGGGARPARGQATVPAPSPGPEPLHAPARSPRAGTETAPGTHLLGTAAASGRHATYGVLLLGWA